ncbi:MAG TPA: biotin--[acetyl-CoA-carboxylase] ligase [Aquificaceae bacterium]|nr:biotin--[acetyl-CoA-carboxylase] ligase [Aquificaceae bacterium]
MFTTLLWLKETDSTQNRLKEWNVKYGTVIVADYQSQGRGRLGRKWISQEGGLYFSFLEDPNNFPSLIEIPLVVGYSIATSLEKLTGVSFSLKWPNDIYYRNKKLSGILCELYKNKLVVGIGINVNQEKVPEEIKDRATTLRLITGKEWNRREVLLKILENIEKDLDLFRKRGFKAFKEKVEKKLSFIGKEVKVIGGEKEIRGKFIGISSRGGALILTDEGLREFLSGDLSLRGEF